VTSRDQKAIKHDQKPVVLNYISTSRGQKAIKHDQKPFMC